MGTGFFPASMTMLRAVAGMGLRLYGSASGYVGFKPQANAGAVDYTLPNAAPSEDEQTLSCTTLGILAWVDKVNGYVWNEIVAASITMAAWNAYIANNASRVTLTLPTTARVGAQIRVAGKGAGGWKIAQNSGQVIHFGNQSTTTGTNGNLQSRQSFDSCEIVCITENSDWLVLTSHGNIDVS